MCHTHTPASSGLTVRKELPVQQMLKNLRVSARLPIDDLAEHTGMNISMEVEGVETVGGLLARRLGLVPIPGSRAEIDGYLLTAETAEGRRNRVSTVRVTRSGKAEED